MSGEKLRSVVFKSIIFYIIFSIETLIPQLKYKVDCTQHTWIMTSVGVQLDWFNIRCHWMVNVLQRLKQSQVGERPLKLALAYSCLWSADQQNCWCSMMCFSNFCDVTAHLSGGFDVTNPPSFFVCLVWFQVTFKMLPLHCAESQNHVFHISRWWQNMFGHILIWYFL